MRNLRSCLNNVVDGRVQLLCSSMLKPLKHDHAERHATAALGNAKGHKRYALFGRTKMRWNNYNGPLEQKE